MQQLAEINNDQTKKMHYYAHQISVLDALDHNVVLGTGVDESTLQV